MPLPASELERLRGCLGRLLPYLDHEHLALTGGAAIELTLASSYLPGNRDVLPDLDFVATSRDAVDPRVADAFLICHYHTPQPGYDKFLVMLVDPVSRFRIDIFPDLAGSIAHARRTTIGDMTLLMLDAERLLTHKLRTLAKATAAEPVDEKHLNDALALAAICGWDVPPVPASHLSPEVYSMDIDARCPRCELSSDPAYPLAPKRAIFDLLGYV